MRNENKFQIAGQEIAPGERWQGMLTIGDGEFGLPAAVLHGEEEGKTVLITAAVHAGEYAGALPVRRGWRRGDGCGACQ